MSVSYQTDMGALPTSDETLVKVLDAFVDSSEQAYCREWVTMALCSWYLRGIRDFRVIDYNNGNLVFHDVDLFDGRMRYQHNAMVKKYSDLVSRIMEMDLTSQIRAGQQGLATMREKATSRVIMAALEDPETVRKVQYDMGRTIAQFGSCAVSAFLDEHPAIGMGAGYEVVPPWEVLPLPIAGAVQGQETGIMRRRMVSLKFLREKFTKATITRNEEKMRFTSAQYGFRPGLDHYGSETSRYLSMRSRSGKLTKEEREGRADHEVYAEMREVWLYGPRHTVSRYIVQIGDWIAVKREFKDEAVYCPLHFGRFIENGSWYGMGLPALIMSQHQQIEKMLTRLYDFVTTLDRFGILMLPHGQFDRNNFHQTDFDLTVGFFEPDMLTGGTRPFHVTPNTPGEMPGRVAAMASALMDQLAPTPEITQGQAPGRVESPSALHFLNQQANAAMSTGSAAIARIKGGCDRYILSEAVKKYREDKTVLDVRRLDIEMIGSAVQSTEDGRVVLELENTPLVDVSKLLFEVVEPVPKSKLARRNEVMELWRNQVLTREEVLIKNADEGLDIPIDDKQAMHTLRLARLNALMLFNDGETPGTLIYNRFAGLHGVTLRVINEVMAMPEFAMASTEVQDSFSSWKQSVESLLGNVLQGGMAPPDEAAATLNMQRQLMQEIERRRNAATAQGTTNGR